MINDKLSTKEIQNLLSNKQFFDIIVEDCVDSTNNIIKKMADDNAKEGLVVIANHQTAGKGRLGRSFYSPDEKGIYMSVLFRPDISFDKSILLTTVAALSVCKAIKEVLCLGTKIKWVNDVLIDNKKVCGILTEGKVSANSEKMDYIVMGIGINIEEPEEGYPIEIKDIATPLISENRQYGQENLKNKLVAKILDNLYFYYNDIDLEEEYIRYEYIPLSDTLGKDIEIIDGDSREEARAIGIAENIGLIVKNDNGIRTLYSGEISIRDRQK